MTGSDIMRSTIYIWTTYATDTKGGWGGVIYDCSWGEEYKN